MGKKKQMAKSWMKSSWKSFNSYQKEEPLLGEIMNEQMQKQLKMIEATLSNAKIDIELLQEENQKLTKLLSLFLVKTGDKLEEQVA
jgi:hypothetical protein